MTPGDSERHTRRTDSTTPRDEETQRSGLLLDDRARVPFAVVAVVLLVSALALVGYVHTDDSSETDTDATLAMDRTDAAVQTALRDSVTRAVERAAEQPVTDPAETAYGVALDDDRPFRSYLKAVIYLETAKRLQNAGQQVGDTNTTVSLPTVTDSESFEEAIDRVTISAGEREKGMLTVRVDGIETTGERNGNQFVSETESIEVSVPTPVMQLHERTERFQSRLNASVLESGFSQRFNARIYALGWARGYAQYLGQPVTEVIASRHIEPAANSALYHTQRAVFGEADPDLRDAVRRGWLCMALKDAEGLYNGHRTGSLTVADDICRASKWILGGEHTGDLPESPGVLDLLGSAPGMDAKHTIGVNQTAYLPLQTVVDGSGRHSLSSVIDRVFTVESDIEADIEAESVEFDHRRPRLRAVLSDRERSNDGVTVHDVGRVVRLPADDEYYEFRGFRASITVTETREWRWREGYDDDWEYEETEDTETIEISGTLRVGSETVGPETDIRGVNNVDVRRNANESTDVPAPEGGFEQYIDAENVTAAVIGGVGRANFTNWLESQWSSVTDENDLALPASKTVDIGYNSSLGGSLERALVADIASLQREMHDVTHTFERRDLIHEGDETGPVGELIEEVNRERLSTLDRDVPYENIGQLAVYEARYAYFEQLLDDLRRVEEAHAETMGKLDDKLAGVDSSLGDAVSFLQQGLTAAEPDPVPIESPELTPNVTYEVSGSPTYLAKKAVTSDDVPQVEEDTTFVPLATKNRNYLKLPYDTIISGLINKIMSIFGNSDSDAELTFRAAGEALQAGGLAADAAADDEYADDQRLTRLTRDLRSAVDDALEEFGVELARAITDELHGTDNSTADTETVITGETRETLEGYNTTAEAAVALGGGNATEPLVENITEGLSGTNHRPAYAENMTANGWSALLGSITRPAIVNATAEQNVTIDSTSGVKALDNATRRALENVSRDIVADRLRSALDKRSFNISQYSDWVGRVKSPVRIPAGLPLLPVPGYWYATVNAWDVRADGEYARFEVTANVGTPGQTSATTYVREDETVTLEIAGTERTVGDVEPIEFDGRSLLVVVVPPGGIGVGDRDDENPECAPEPPDAGPVDDDDDGRCRLLP